MIRFPLCLLTLCLTASYALPQERRPAGSVTLPHLRPLTDARGRVTPPAALTARVVPRDRIGRTGEPNVSRPFAPDESARVPPPPAHGRGPAGTATEVWSLPPPERVEGTLQTLAALVAASAVIRKRKR